MKAKKGAPVPPLDPEEQLHKLTKRLKELRLKSGYTSAKTFAIEKGINRAQYARYEKGTGGDPQFTTLVKLDNAFGLTLEEFFSEGFE